MKNKMTDLNNYLFEAIERLNNDELEPEELEKEIKRCEPNENCLVCWNKPLEVKE